MNDFGKFINLYQSNKIFKFDINYRWYSPYLIIKKISDNCTKKLYFPFDDKYELQKLIKSIKNNQTYISTWNSNHYSNCNCNCYQLKIRHNYKYQNNKLKILIFVNNDYYKKYKFDLKNNLSDFNKIYSEYFDKNINSKIEEID